VTLRLAGVLAAMAMAATAQPGASVQGRVASSLHDEPVAHAMVTLRGLQASGGAKPQVYVCETGADGRFSIVDVAPGRYDPQPSKQGYESHPPNRAAAHDYSPVTVEAGKPVTELELRMIPDSVIAGRVLDADGDPVRYAQVEALQYGYLAGDKELQIKRTAQTNDRGEYRMFYLPPGHYYLRAEATPRSVRLTTTVRGNEQFRGTLSPSTLTAAYYPGVTDPTRATELQAQPGGELDGIDLSLAPESLYSIRGRFPSGDPAKTSRGIRVIERLATDRRPQYFVQTTNDSYEIRNLAPGSYYVFGEATDAANPEERQYARQPVEVIDRDVEGVDLVFLPGARVTGTVKLEGSSPVPIQSLAMFLQPAGSLAREQIKVAADGKFASLEIAPGMYQFGVAGHAYLKSVRVGEQEADGGKIDTEHLAGPVMVVVSADFGKAEGTVTDDAGKPVSNARVTLIPDQSISNWHDRFQNETTTSAGKFSFTDIEPGDYKVFAWVGVQPGAPENADFRKPYEELGKSVKVEAGGRQSLVLRPIVIAPNEAP
jgi:hypothetical protein